MAKLNKMEITAIAEDIISKIKVNKNPITFEKYLEEFLETSEAEYINQLIGKVNYLHTLMKDFHYTNKYGGNGTMNARYEGSVESVALYKYNKQYPRKEPPSLSDITRELIISQISSEDIDGIIARLVDKYSK